MGSLHPCISEERATKTKKQTKNKQKQMKHVYIDIKNKDHHPSEQAKNRNPLGKPYKITKNTG